MIPRRPIRNFLVSLADILEGEERNCRSELRMAMISDNIERASFARGGLNAVERCRMQVIEYSDLLDLIDFASDQADIWFDISPGEAPVWRRRLTGFWWMGIQTELLLIFRRVDSALRG